MIKMATQADIDALTTQLATLSTTLTADDGAIQAAIAALSAQGVDVTALQAAVSTLSSAVDATTALVPAATTPTG
jgi:ABC-type xylose transport system substrate-binding protein